MKEISIPHSIGFRTYYRSFLGDFTKHIFFWILASAGSLGYFLLARYSESVFENIPLLIASSFIATGLLLDFFVSTLLWFLWFVRIRPSTDVEILLSSNGIYFESSRGTNRYSWEKVNECKETESTFVLTFDGVPQVIIPKSRLHELEAYLVFKELLKNKNLPVIKEYSV